MVARGCGSLEGVGLGCGGHGRCLGRLCVAALGLGLSLGLSLHLLHGEPPGSGHALHIILAVARHGSRGCGSCQPRFLLPRSCGRSRGAGTRRGCYRCQLALLLLLLLQSGIAGLMQPTSVLPLWWTSSSGGTSQQAWGPNCSSQPLLLVGVGVHRVLEAQHGLHVGSRRRLALLGAGSCSVRLKTAGSCLLLLSLLLKGSSLLESGQRRTVVRRRATIACEPSLTGLIVGLGELGCLGGLRLCCRCLWDLGHWGLGKGRGSGGLCRFL
mmetsp:Transcript_86233/g.180428  ORF Transcript_86233/g.180428 Transcript_86233/m.180428 type:complete len:269 (+) Transcript_86233:1057-1863(+)